MKPAVFRLAQLFLMLVAFVLLILASLSVPIVKSISYIVATSNSDSFTRWSLCPSDRLNPADRVSQVGLYGACLNDDCSSTTIGYALGEQVDTFWCSNMLIVIQQTLCHRCLAVRPRPMFSLAHCHVVSSCTLSVSVLTPPSYQSLLHQFMTSCCHHSHRRSARSGRQANSPRRRFLLGLARLLPNHALPHHGPLALYTSARCHQR